MNSKIIVEMDFDKKEPYLQIILDTNSGVLADKTLKHFIEEANQRGINVMYFTDNLNPQIRLRGELLDGSPAEQSIIVTETSELFRKWLDSKNITHSAYNECLEVFGVTNDFNFGVEWATYKINKKALLSCKRTGLFI
jgi:hypothetical protein